MGSEMCIRDSAYRDPTDNVNGSSNIQNNNVSQYNQTQAETEAVTNDDRPQETEAQKPYDKTVSE